MPWVNVICSKELSIEQQDELKTGIALIFQQIMDKKEDGLTITFIAAAGFYRGGQSAENAAVVEVRYIGKYTENKKTALVRCISGLLARVVDFEQGKVIVPITEFLSENYGRSSGDNIKSPIT